ncbi:MAG: Glu/Leu/Phe/Val dehydrogenase [Planctomycetes bacterium]|nr:Glu/Leu/Phe/Val dehydrogenase [Planctomycetota bacterium]
MQITEIPMKGYERVAKAHDPETGLRAIVAIHDRTLGPALGGMRMWNYSTDDEALTDVLRLARGMTYKSAVARTGLGGGKSVVIGDARSQKSPALFHAMGNFIDSFQGAYITAEDVGTSVADLKLVRESTKWVTGLSRDDGGSGNPSPYTALGCFVGLRAVLERVFGNASPAGRTIAIQGVGAVGSSFAEMLVKAGANVIVGDLYQERAESLARKIGARVSSMNRILFEDCDVLSPCALGGIMNDSTIPQLRCRAVAGCANNQLLEPVHGDLLHSKGILYAPDYVINAGGIINVGCELLKGGYDEASALKRIDSIYDAMKQVFHISETEKIPTYKAADLLAEKILKNGTASKH